MNWFDVERIDDKTYVISENQHYEETNSYLLLGETFNVCVDCGIGLHKIEPVLEEIDSKPRRVIITHSHWDHLGNHDQFDVVYLHSEAKRLLERGGLIPLEKIKDDIIRDVDPSYIPAEFEASKYTLYDGCNGEEITGGDRIDQGGRTLEIIHTPGHTIDSISVFEASTGYLFVGDLLYQGMLYACSEQNNPDDYFESIAKLLEKEELINCVFSGHYQPDLGKEYVRKVHDLFVAIKRRGNWRKGTGVHNHGGLEIML